MNTTKVNGLSVTDHEGSGEPLIFIHAFPMCCRMWDKQTEYFKDKYRVITYDVRGLGYSTEAGEFPFTMEDLADDLFGIIEHFNFGKVNAAGLSMGGYILLRALVKDQSKFKTAVLADTKAEDDNNESLLNRSAAVKMLSKGKKEEFINNFTKKVLSEESYKNDKLVNEVKEIIGWQSEKGIASSMLAIASRLNLTYDLEKIETPLLIITGEHDSLTPTTKAFYIREYAKNTSFEKIIGAGHFSNMEKPNEFNNAMEDFLKTHNG